MSYTTNWWCNRGMAASKITLTLPDDLLSVVGSFVATHEGTTRSGVCAEALREWLRSQQEAAIAASCCEQSPEDRAEDASWRPVAVESAKRLWVSERGDSFPRRGEIWSVELSNQPPDSVALAR
jgi:hypothetical protein